MADDDIPSQETISTAIHDDQATAARRTAFVAFVVCGFALMGLLVFAGTTVYQTFSHNRQISELLAAQQQSQKEAAGNNAMIFAVCTALNRRDLLTQQKWAAVTRIEDEYKNPNPSDTTDVAYHAARRKVLDEAKKADDYIVHFDCRGGMEKAYWRGVRTGELVSTKPPKVNIAPQPPSPNFFGIPTPLLRYSPDPLLRKH